MNRKSLIANAFSQRQCLLTTLANQGDKFLSAYPAEQRVARASF
jgi:hypothetical protein